MPQVRFGVSLDEDVLKTLDNFVIRNNFPNSSQAIRHLVETANIEEDWKNNDMVSGAIILLYDHHKNELGSKMDNIQHSYYKEILATQHFHIDHDNCLEIIAVKGNANRLKELASQLISLKGIVHGKIVTSKMI